MNCKMIGDQANTFWAKRALLCSFLFGSALTPIVARAQAAGADAAPTTVQEIVVTAQRRAENIQDTPLAVSAFNAQTLKDTGVASVQDLGQVVPSLEVASTAGNYLPFLRGVGNNNGSVGNESSVATYIDDLYYTHLATAYLQLGDINNVEVLNGPQGTLFGRDSSGGAIQMFTKDPGKKPEIDATVGYANYDTISGNLYFSAPITDRLAWNVAIGYSDQRQGWGHSLLTGQPTNLGKYFTARSKLVWEPTDTTKIKIVGFYAHSNTDFGDVQGIDAGTYGLTPVGTGIPGYPNPPQVLTSLQNNPGTYYDNRLNSPPYDIENGYGGSLRIDQDLGFGDFVSITGFRNATGLYHVDLDFSPENLLNVDLHDIDRSFSEELQIKSKRGSPIQWIAGAFYLHWRAGYDPVQAYGDSLDYGVAPGTVLHQFGIQLVKSYSGFGQVTVPLGKATNVTGGIRVTRDETSAYGEQDLAIPGVGSVDAAPAGLPNPYLDSNSVTAVSYRAAIDHHFTKDVMAYASVSRGFKSGAYNTIGLETPAALPEIVHAYEVGVKSELFDRRLRLNLALYWNAIKDPQVLTTVNTGLVDALSLTNAQKARSRGVEVSFDAVVADGFKVRGGVTYDDAVYTQFDNAPIFSGGLVPGANITGPTLGNGAGNGMANVPKWRFDAGANYKLNSAIGVWVGDVNIGYTDRFPWTADNNLWQRSVTLVNASLNFTPAAMSGVTFSFWGKNLGNAKYNAIGQETVGPAGTAGYVGAPAAPLTYGGTISFKY